jgi:hypothetical protein
MQTPSIATRVHPMFDLSSLVATAAAAARDECNRLVLAHLDAIESPGTLKTERDAELADSLSRILGRLSCATFNSAHPEDRRVWDIEARWNERLAAYNRRFLIRDSGTLALARYMTTRRCLVGVDPRCAFVLAVERGILRLHEGRLYVVGLNCAIGDNLFTVDRLGRHHRQYRRTAARLAVGCPKQSPWPVEALAGVVEPAGDRYTCVEVGDGKYSAREPAFTRARTLVLADTLGAVGVARIEAFEQEIGVRSTDGQVPCPSSERGHGADSGASATTE